MKCINSKEDLLDASKIGYLYLYLSESNSIVVDNDVTKLELTMSDNGYIMATNLRYPNGKLFYNEMLTLESLLAIISQLKEQPGVYGDNKWQDICLDVGSTLALNQ